MRITLSETHGEESLGYHGCLSQFNIHLRQQMKLVIFLLVVAVGLCTDYRKVLPKGSWQINIGEFDQVRGDILMAFGDYNLDGFTDILTVDSLTSTLVALNLWDNTNHVFLRKELTTLSSFVKSVITADTNNDGYPDLVVTQTNTNSYNISVLLLDGCVNGGCSFTHVSDDRGELRAVDPVEPFVLDLDGDRVPELVFVKGNVRHVAIFKDLGVGVREFDSFVNKPNNTEGFPIYPAVVYPQLDQHYASLVDVDGDCMTDLVLISGNSTSKYLEFYTNLQNGLLSQPKFVPISSNVKSMSFTDINFDGANDLVLVEQGLADTNSILELHINQHPSDAYNLCSPTTEFPFDFGQLYPGTLKKIQRLTLPEMISLTDPTLKFADFNLDGYADLAIVVTFPDSSTPAAQVYINAQCHNQECGTYNPDYTSLANTTNLRFFKRYNMSYNSSNVSSVAIFDLYEDGEPDILLNQYTTKNNIGRVTSIVAILNNYEYDTFFIKIQTVNGVHNKSKTTASLIGICYEWVVTGLNGDYIPAVGTQGMQVSHRAMPLPYAMSGLGRTNNFIENFYAGLPSNSSPYSRKWSPIVPNTHIIVSANSSTPSAWKLSMYLQPTEKLTLVFVLTLVALGLVGLMIYYYHRKEQNENRENRDDFYIALS